MIVVDANIIAYRVLANDRTASAMRLFDMDGEWISTSLWEYEFSNILAMPLRNELWNVQQALNALRDARKFLAQVMEPSTETVFEIVRRHKITAYDATYVALVIELNVPLVTEDKELLKKFPGKTYSMETYWNAFGNRDLQEPAREYRVSSKQKSVSRKKGKD
jgi:predicted nucleic acid-binding protein